MLRGEIYAARLDPVEGSEQAGTRPVVVVSNDLVNELLPIVTVLPVTAHRAGRRLSPGHVAVPRGQAGLRTDSLVLVHQIRTISKARLGRRIGRLTESAVGRVDAALRVHLSLETE